MRIRRAVYDRGWEGGDHERGRKQGKEVNKGDKK